MQCLPDASARIFQIFFHTSGKMFLSEHKKDQYVKWKSLIEKGHASPLQTHSLTHKDTQTHTCTRTHTHAHARTHTRMQGHVLHQVNRHCIEKNIYTWSTRLSSAFVIFTISSLMFYFNSSNVWGFVLVHFVLQAAPQVKITDCDIWGAKRPYRD